MSDQPVEIELTLRVDQAAPAKLLSDRLIKSLMVGKISRRRLVSTYFDTPTQKLRSDGIALRIRRVGRACVQTVKINSPQASGLLTRIEEECRVASDRPEPSAIRDRTIAKRLLRKRVATHLTPQFSTEFVRTTVPLRLATGEVELAIDKGRIVAGERFDPVCEVEIELRSGTVAAVYELGQHIAGIVDVTIEPRPKAERGYALLANQQIEATKAGEIRLEKSSNFGEVVRAIGRSCAIQIRRNLLAARLARSDEAIHQLRVGLRRARTLMSILRSIGVDADASKFIDRFKTLMFELAPAREWDVFRAEVVPHLSRVIGARPVLDRFVRLVEQQRAGAHQRAAAAVAGGGVAQALLQFEAWIEGGDAWTALGAEADQPARVAARAVLQRMGKKAAKLFDGIAEAEDQRIHDLRLRMKRLRYGAEFFADLFSTKKTKPYLNGLAALQDHLGAFNDGVVGTAMMATLPAGDVTLVRAIDAASGWCGAIAQRERAAIPDALATFREQKPFWR